MGPVNPMLSDAPGMSVTDTEDVGWYQVEHLSAPGTVRRAAMSLADRLGFGESRAGEVGIIASELASNQIKYSERGVVLLRSCRRGDEVGVELVAVDSGPGMTDLAGAFADGRSTSGTLGIGLGAVARLATSWDGYSVPGQGTVLHAAVGPDGTSRLGGLAQVAGLTRPIRGEAVCGDAHSTLVRGGIVSTLLVDGLGHGPLAAQVAQVAIRAFDAAPEDSAGGLLMAVHRALTGTRGAAAAVLQYDGRGLTYAGIGNITGWITDGERRQAMISVPGIVGVRGRAVRELSYGFSERSAVIIHSDGVTDRLDLRGRRGLFACSPVVIAATTMRDFGIRHDDAAVLVLLPDGR